MARDMSLGDPNQEREEGGLTSVIEEDPLSKCALFVCNKWEQVPEQEVQSVKDDTVKKLGKVWPGIDPESVFHPQKGVHEDKNSYLRGVCLSRQIYECHVYY